MDFIKGTEQVKIDPIGIEISGANNIILKSDGKVGIGTNNPQHPLQVNGSQAIFSNTPELLLFKEFGPGRLGPTLDWGTTGFTDWKIKAEDSSLKIMSGINNNTNESISISNTGTIDISGDVSLNGDLSLNGDIVISGNVGIGTSNPEHLLHLKSSGDAVLRIEADDDDDGENDNPLIYLSQDDGQVYSKFGINGTSGSSDATFPEAKTNGCFIQCDKSLQFAPGDTVKMTILKDGEVGIGITNPTEKLEVNGNIKANGFKIPVILFGNVNSGGGIEDSGSGGWSSTRSGTGKYTVTFTTQFSSRPAAIITQVYPDFGTATHGVGNLKDGFLVNGIDTGKFYCSTGDGNGSLSDRNFSFMVMGYI